MPPDHLLLIAAVALIGFLYSSVGHAGASGYIAVMSLAGLAPEVIKPTALTLNIFVAAITAGQFYRAGHFSWSLFWPFTVLAIPMAFLGGYLDLPTRAFKVLVGVVLLFSAWRFMARPSADGSGPPPRRTAALALGGGLGLLSGLTGTGGGIFLTPLLLWTGWARVKTAAAVSALFILCNSVAGLLGNWSSTRSFPAIGIWLLGAAIAGGSFGAYFGSRRFNPLAIKRLLAVVLFIAGAKLVLGR
ncbi:MAG TPA: sulfite exporter TauE/SafE family protein [Kiritimatiellia bacterium]|nr:sulfite exporter TauE/SafE family protein [Kiritimatiellia bacterium]